MSTAPKPKSNIEPIKASTYVATLYQIVYLGTQKQEWKGNIKELPKVRLTFELPKLLKVWKEGEEAKPRVISRDFTFSMGGKANLRKFIEGIEGVSLLDSEAYAYDVDTLLGKSCLISVSCVNKNDKTYNNIETASPLMDDMVAPKKYNPNFLFDVNSFDQKKFETLPEFLQEKIKASPEYKGRNGLSPEAIADLESARANEVGGHDEEINPSDIPF